MTINSPSFKCRRRVAVVVFLAAALLPALSMSQEPAPDGSADAALNAGIANIRGGAIDVVLRAEPRCYFSDLEAIQLEVRHARPETRLLLSIEDVQAEEESFPPVAVEVVRGGNQPGETALQLKLPTNLRGPKLAGLFVCTDSKQEKRCAGKDARSFDDIFKQYEVVIDPRTSHAYRPPDYQSESGYVADKIFFFRYIILDGNEVRFPQKALNAESYVTLARELQGAAEPQALGRTRYLSDLLGSLPLKAQGGRIIASLPYYDPRKCQGAS